MDNIVTSSLNLKPFPSTLFPEISEYSTLIHRKVILAFWENRVLRSFIDVGEQ